MKTLLLLSTQDLRTTFRDPVFKGLFFFPLLAFAMVKWGLPAAVEALPVMGDYLEPILMWACLQSAMMFGFIYGFLYLEEKEEGVDLALSVLPVPTFVILSSRLLVGFSFSVLVNWLLIHFGGIVKVEYWQEVLLALHFALAAPLMALYLRAFAGSRIEGMAQLKILNLIFYVPALVYFLPQQWLHAFAVIPTYWSFRSMDQANSNTGFWLAYGVGILVYGATGAFMLWKGNRTG